MPLWGRRRNSSAPCPRWPAPAAGTVWRAVPGRSLSRTISPSTTGISPPAPGAGTRPGCLPPAVGGTGSCLRLRQLSSVRDRLSPAPACNTPPPAGGQYLRITAAAAPEEDRPFSGGVFPFLSRFIKYLHQGSNFYLRNRAQSGIILYVEQLSSHARQTTNASVDPARREWQKFWKE